LLRILNGELSPIAGSVRHTVPIAYFGQEAGSLHGETVIQAYRHDRVGHPMTCATNSYRLGYLNLTNCIIVSMPYLRVNADGSNGPA